MSQRKYFTNFLGDFGHAPRGMRGTMRARVMEWWRLHKDKEYILGKNDSWREIMADSKVSLCPRGFGRSSYHIAETLQMGLVPIHVYYDIPWVYYGKLWHEEQIGFVTHCDGLKDLLSRIASNESKLVEMETRIRSMRESHFLRQGVMNQIHLFMTGRGGDLRCQALPQSPK
eukprot:TRINITY_DN26988_c0_g1_i2.p1 TRINITY_DN26988_c0_g1~~TRINITY_DN26988_c0_g1_i2.p1  ORF type:complete len:172 (-),score=25.83 TRINITY_DN26988_c0_g1_i2:13-528(-)